MDSTRHESTRRKALLTAGVVMLTAGAAAFGTFAAFTATTANSGNRIEAGSVAISDSDGGTGVLYNALDQRPGSANGPAARCIRVTSTGSITSAVKLYRSAVTNGANFHLRVERGSGITTPAANMNCTGFSSSSTAFDDSLDEFPTTAAAGVDAKAAGATWATNDTVDYRFTIYTIDDPTPNARTSKSDSGSHSYTWEATSN